MKFLSRFVPDLVAAHARKIQRLVAALQAIGRLLGGNAGARLAQGLQEDLAAVKAGLTLPWSNGPSKGRSPV
jgi:transposase